MAEYISRAAAIAYIRERSEECQKAFEELGGESGIYADAYNDLAEDFYRVPAADVVAVTRCKDCKWDKPDVLLGKHWCSRFLGSMEVREDDFCSYGKPKEG